VCGEYILQVFSPSLATVQSPPSTLPFAEMLVAKRAIVVRRVVVVNFIVVEDLFCWKSLLWI
jgi:hypothetical protein